MKTNNIFMIIIASIIIILLTILIVEILTLIICWSFGFDFSVKLGLGVWAIMFIVKIAISNSDIVKFNFK